jgi:hypothetical protein
MRGHLVGDEQFFKFARCIKRLRYKCAVNCFFKDNKPNKKIPPEAAVFFLQ